MNAVVSLVVRDSKLADGAAGGRDGREQVRGGRGVGTRAGGALAVYRDRRGTGRIAPEQVGKSSGAHQDQHAAQGGRGGCATHAEGSARTKAQAGEGILGRVSGPLADGEVRAGTGQDRAGGSEQDRDKRVAASTPVARVGQGGQPGCHVGQVTLLTRGRLGKTDGGRLTAHRGSGYAGRLRKVTPSTGASMPA